MRNGFYQSKFFYCENSFIKCDIYHLLLRLYDAKKARKIYSRIYYYPMPRLKRIQENLLEAIVFNKPVDEALLRREHL